MKKAIIFIMILSVTFSALNICVYADGDKPNIKSQNAILVDNNTGKALYKQNTDEKLKPGGFVKVMTAIIAIENMADKNEIITADGDVLASYDYSFGNMGILAGETLTLEDLLYGMLLYDAGDAAEIIANYSSTSRKKFIKLMNEKAVALGALNTKFTNPTGFPDKGQYSTVDDFYKITKYAMSLPFFAEIVNTGMYQIAPTNKYHQTRYLPNSNKFITRYSSDKYYTSKAKGVKTSYINDKNCGLILYYESSGVSFTCITTNSPYDGENNYAYEDAKTLLKYGSEYYKSEKLITKGEILAEVTLDNGKNTDRILLEAPEDLNVNLPKNYDKDKLKKITKKEKNIKAPLKKGQALGVVRIMYDGEEYASMVLTCPEDVEANNIKGLFRKIWSVISSPVLLVTLGILLIIFVWSTLIFNRKKQVKYKR